MNAASAWRVALARTQGALYADAGALAALCISSSARGTADAFSDLDLLVLWHAEPTDAARAGVVERSGGNLIRLYPRDERWQGWGDLYTLGDTPQRPHTGLICDVSHMLAEDFGAFVEAASSRHSTEEEHQNAAAMLAYGIDLEGHALLDKLRAVLRFERELAVALIARWGVIDHFWRWRGALARGNNVVLADAVLAGALERMLQVLFALNRRYFIGVGHLEEAVAVLEKAPAGLSERLTAGLAAPLAERAEAIRELIEETFAMVERELPEVDVERLRRVFRFERGLHEEPPASLAPSINPRVSHAQPL